MLGKNTFMRFRNRLNGKLSHGQTDRAAALKKYLPRNRLNLLSNEVVAKLHAGISSDLLTQLGYRCLPKRVCGKHISDGNEVAACVSKARMQSIKRRKFPPKGPCFLELPRDKPPPRIISNNCRHGGNLVETWWKLGGTIVETWWKPGGK
jgi:hypothetical protein